MCVYNYISFRQAWPEKIKINKLRQEYKCRPDRGYDTNDKAKADP